jgi:predicted metalloprotease with PDZ domain
MIHYQVSSSNPAAHYFEVKITIDNPDSAGQCLRMPNWIPGSYMIRDFARNLLSLQAYCDGKEIRVDQLDKSNWRLQPCDGIVTVEYLVYSWDLSVRAAHLDQTHGYFNGTSLFMEVVGRAEEACELLIERPTHACASLWKLATTLQTDHDGAFEFGLYRADDYDDLIDHPVEMADFTVIHFEACGVPHDLILSGKFSCDQDRLARDLKIICEHHIQFFGEPAPMDYYQFLVMVVGQGYGGLEHRSSTSLMCERDGLPQKGQVGVNEGYRDFLGLCSHEYFHTWNVKRIKPAVYQPYDLQQEVYTDLLWAFEGITSYYDDLALVRCGLIDQTSFLELLAQTMTRVQRGKGSRRQSAAESSFNTWTKFYRQDENAQNAIVSYYAKGCLIALCIDLKIRELSQSRLSLDDVMKQLWKLQLASGAGVETNTIQDLVCELVGSDLHDFMHQLIYTGADMPLPELLATVGIEFSLRPAGNQKDKGGIPWNDVLPAVELGAFMKEKNGDLQVLRVSEDGAAQTGGLSANDVIIAVNGLKLTLAKLEQKLALASIGDHWIVHAFRRDELMEFDLELVAASCDTVVLQPNEENQARINWLKDD